MCSEKFEQFIDFVRIKCNGDVFPGTETDNIVGTIAGIRQQYDMCKAEKASLIYYLTMSDETEVLKQHSI